MFEFNETVSKIWELVKDISGVVGALSFVIEFTPIKLHPLSFICSKLGKAFNKEIKSEMDAMKKDLQDDLKTVKSDIQEVSTNLKKTEEHFTEEVKKIDTKSTERYIKQLRGDILNFSNSCMNHKLHTKDEFEHVIAEHEEYEELLKSLGRTNGVVSIEFEYIKDVYQKCCKDNSFL